MDLHRNNAFRGKLLVVGILAAGALMALCYSALSAGPYLEKYAREHAVVEPLAIDASVCARAVDGEDVFTALDANMPYEPTPAQIDQLPDPEGLVAFSMNPATRIAPSLSNAEKDAIEQALSYFSDRRYVCSCLVVDLSTGRVVGSDYDVRVYGASAFKGVVAAYVCEEMIDGASYELGGSLQSLIESSVRWSDNDAYRSLKTGYAGGIASWVSDMGVDPTYVSRYRFPTYSARESTALWAHINSYLNSGSDTALWLGEQLSSTNVSQIRDAVERGLADGSLAEAADEVPEGRSLLEHHGATVQNKAGWISGGYNSTSDAGLVHLDERTYAISIMTSAPDSAASREAVTQLALELLRAMR